MSDEKNIQCHICGIVQKDKQNIYPIKERRYGLYETFQYFLCEKCGCLQIVSYPNNIEKYYSDNYHSVVKHVPIRFNKKIKLKIKKLAYKNILFEKLLALISPNAVKNVKMLKFISKMANENVLDVGCGVGYLLDDLAIAGLKKLQGVDLFIDNDMTTTNGVKIKKGTIYDINPKNEYEKFDLVMLHHSLEHMPDQQFVLNKITNILRKKGACLVRIPVCNLAWEMYGEYWYQIDAPRHFYLHTENSMAVLADKAGLKITKVIYDSTANQFSISELYKKEIPLNKQTKEIIIKKIGRKKMKEYIKNAQKLNSINRGDQAIFVLHKK